MTKITCSDCKSSIILLIKVDTEYCKRLRMSTNDARLAVSEGDEVCLYFKNKLDPEFDGVGIA